MLKKVEAYRTSFLYFPCLLQNLIKVGFVLFHTPVHRMACTTENVIL
jgi:hypothetical protein